MIEDIRSEDILFERRGAAGHVLLNRPKALNTLTYEMCTALHAQLDLWAADDTVRLVILEGAGEKAFCAGGDIRKLYDICRGGGAYPAMFFADEYRLNAAIKAYPKPYIAIMDGIVMGGGVGVSVPGSHRVLTERTMCAMPETAIGFFPDVGGNWFLARTPQFAGIYLGLTGARMNAADAIYAGFGDCMVPSDKGANVVTALCEHQYSGDAHGDVDAILDQFTADPGMNSLQAIAEDVIKPIFSLDRLEDMLAALDSLGTDFGGKTASTIRRHSPVALKVTRAAIRKAYKMEFNEVLEMEYRLAMRFMGAQDFYEGVRAAVIDKDRAPKWLPAKLEDVSDETVSGYFKRLAPEKELSLS